MPGSLVTFITQLFCFAAGHQTQNKNLPFSSPEGICERVLILESSSGVSWNLPKKSVMKARWQYHGIGGLNLQGKIRLPSIGFKCLFYNPSLSFVVKLIFLLCLFLLLHFPLSSLSLTARPAFLLFYCCEQGANILSEKLDKIIKQNCMVNGFWTPQYPRGQRMFCITLLSMSGGIMNTFAVLSSTVIRLIES